MTTTLKEIQKIWQDAIQEGNLTFNSALAFENGLSSFLNALPSNQIQLSQVQITLDDPPTRLTLSASTKDEWPIRGLKNQILTLATLFLEYKENNPNLLVQLTVKGSLQVGTFHIPLIGSLDDEYQLKLEGPGGALPDISLSTIANYISNEALSSYLPTGIDLFDHVPFTALALKPGFQRVEKTEIAFTADINKTWTIVPDLAVLDKVGITLLCLYSYGTDHHFRSTYGGNIHGTLTIPPWKLSITAQLALLGFNRWEIQLIPQKGDILPGLNLVARLLGGAELEQLVAKGLQLLEIKEIALDNISLGIDLNQKSLLYSSMTGHVSLSDFTFNVQVSLPHFAFHGYLKPGNPVKLKTLLSRYVGHVDFLPEVDINVFSLSADPTDGTYSLSAAVTTSFQFTIAGFAMACPEFHLRLDRDTNKKITGVVGGKLKIGETDIFLDAGFDNEFFLDGHIPSMKITQLTRSFLGNLPLPAELPEVILSDIALYITPKTGEFSFEAKADVTCALGESELNAQLDLALNRQPDTEALNGLALSGHLKLALTEALQILPELSIQSFNLAFILQPNHKWDISGGIKIQLFQETFELKAGYKEGKLTLWASTNRALLDLPGIAVLKVTEVALELQKEKDTLQWSFAATGELLIADTHSFKGELKLYSGPKEAGLVLKMKEMSVTIPLVPPDMGVKLCSGDIAIVRQEKNWRFEANASLAFLGFPPVLYQHKIIPPDPVAVSFAVDARGATLTVKEITGPIDFLMPDIEMPDKTIISMAELRRLGAARLKVSNLEIAIGKKLSLSVILGIGLPVDLDKIFGTNPDGSPVFQIFNTLPQMLEFKFGIGYLPQKEDIGIIFEVNKSPFRQLVIENNVWKCDLGSFGALDIEIPSFSLKGDSFSAHIGFKIVRPLCLPMQPVKELLQRIGSGGVAALIPASVPLTALNLIDESGNIRDKEFIQYLEDFLKAIGAPALPDPIKTVFQTVFKYAKRLPKGLTQYLRFDPPDSFEMDISVTADAGIGIKIKVSEEKPLRLLFPGISGGLVPLPVIQGITLRGFSLGALMGGTLYYMEVDADFDQFDMVSLLAGLALPEFGVLPPSKDFHFRVLINELLLLIVFIYGFPVPVPLFYKRLGFEYLGIEGVTMQSHVNFPKPTFNLQELVRLFVACKQFFTDKNKRLLKSEIPEQMNLRFWVDNTYLKMPDYLGGKMLGKEGAWKEINMLETIMALMNSVKFMSLDDLVQVVELTDRVGSAELQFIGLVLQADWLITTPTEFKNGAYKGLRIPPEQVATYLQLLAGGGDTRGIAIFLKGLWQIPGIAGLDTSFGLMLAGANGFSTQFRIEGFLNSVFYLRLMAAVDLIISQSPDIPTRFQLKGSSYLRFLGVDVFKGDILVQAQRDRFHLEGQFNLLPEDFPINAYGKINGTVDQTGVSFDAEVATRLGLVVFSAARAVINNSGAMVKATWLLAAVDFTLQDNDNRFLLLFNADIVLATLTVRFDIYKLTREFDIFINGTLLNLYGLTIQSRKRASVPQPTPQNPYPVASETGVEGDFSITHLGLVILQGTSISTPSQFSFNGRFHLLPEVSPINIVGSVNGSFSPGKLDLQGSVSTTLGPLQLTNASANLTDKGLRVSGSWLNYNVSLEFREKGEYLESSLLLPGIVTLDTQLSLRKAGFGGSADITATVGGLVVKAGFRLPEVAAQYNLTFFNLPLLGGDISFANNRFDISGNLFLSFLSLINFQATLTGSIDGQRVSLSGKCNTSSIIPGVPAGDGWVTWNNDSMTISLTLHFLWPVGDIGAAASLRWWRGKLCFMIAWKIWWWGYDYNHLAVSFSGIESIGIAWNRYPDDWPADLRQGAFSACGSFAQNYPINDPTVEPLPILELVSLYLFGIQSQPARDMILDTEPHAHNLQNCADHQIEIQLLPSSDADNAEKYIQVILHQIPGTRGYLTVLKEELERRLAAVDVQSQPVPQLQSVEPVVMDNALVCFETPWETHRPETVMLHLQCRYKNIWRYLAAPFDFKKPEDAYQRLADLLRKM